MKSSSDPNLKLKRPFPSQPATQRATNRIKRAPRRNRRVQQSVFGAAHSPPPPAKVSGNKKRGLEALLYKKQLKAASRRQRMSQHPPRQNTERRTKKEPTTGATTPPTSDTDTSVSVSERINLKRRTPHHRSLQDGCAPLHHSKPRARHKKRHTRFNTRPRHGHTTLRGGGKKNKQINSGQTNGAVRKKSQKKRRFSGRRLN